MEVWVNLEFGDGNFKSGFSNINLKVMLADTQHNITQLEVQLPPDEGIPVFYQRWKEQYYSLLNHFRGKFKNSQVTHISKSDCHHSVECLRYQLHQWLHPIEVELKQALPQNIQQEICLVVHTEKIASDTTKDILHRLPWQEWDFLAQKLSGEAAVCFQSCVASGISSEESSTASKIRRARILSIFGDSTNIDTSVDKELLQKLQKRAAELIILTEPNRSDFNALWEEACDILFFAGHSETQDDGQTGIININPKDSLSLEEIKKTLRAAINKGLKLAIFNSCNGLGLARQLADLHLPYIIVWREEVPDKLAQKFLQYFLSSFSQGESLFNSVRQARDKLSELADEKDIAKQLPGVSWLPIICQNTTEPPPRWEDLGGLSGELPECPYQGLSAFRQENAEFFFGRERFIGNLVEAANSNPLVAVIGASGSGKSSVVFAGLIPHLQATGDVEIISFRPGKNPFDAMAIALSKSCQHLVQGQTEVSGGMTHSWAELEIEGNLHHFKTELCHIIQQIITFSSIDRLVLVVDQFEELYTLVPEKERHSFLNALLSAVKFAPSFTLVLTLRADFLGIALDYQPMGKALQAYAPLLLTPMDAEELRDAIEQPALKMKVELEKGLTSKLINDVGNHPGGLPMLEFALSKLWSKQQNWYLTHQAYEEIGGLEKALAQYATEVLNQLSATEKQRAERVFIQLVCPGEGTEDTRRVATQKEVGKENWDLVKRLADARLVVTGWDETEEIETVEIVHEALIREWGILREWIKTNRDFRRWQERLRAAILQWKETEQDRGALLRGAGLVEAEEKLKERCFELSQAEQEFIQASVVLREREKKERSRRQLLTNIGLGSFSTVALGLAVLTWWQSQNSVKSEIKAIVANSESLFALNKKFDSLIEAIRANQKQQQLFVVDPDIQNQVLKALQQVVYRVVEYNRLLPKDNSDSNLVWDVAISPDGQLIASASQDNTVHLWNHDGSELRTLRGHRDRVWRVVFSQDNQIIASASNDKTVKLWNRDGKVLHTLIGHSDVVWGVAIGSDSQIIASASNDKTVILWRRDGKKLYTLKGHDSSVRAVTFSPDGQLIVSTSENGTVKFWSRDGRELRTLQGHQSRVAGVAFSPDGQLMATASDDGTAKLWSRDGKELHTLKGHNDTVWGVAFSPDGKLIATASWDKTIKLWNRDGTLLTTVNGHTARAYGVAFSSDGQTIASTSEDKTVRLWRINNPLLNVLNAHSKPVIGVSFSPNSQLVASASDDKTVKIWNRNGILLKTLPHTDSVLGVKISPDGKTVASGTWDGNIRIWNIDDGKLLRIFNGRSKAVWDVTFSPDSQLIASAGFDGTVKLWTREGKLLHTFNGHNREVREVAFSSDGRLIASASLDGTVKLWTREGKLLHTFNGHSDGVLGLAFSPDRQTIASASLDGTVKLWKLDGTLQMNLTGHEDGVRGVSFSPDGKVIASASGDGSIKLWRSQDGALLNTLRGHRSAVWKVKFSFDGEKIVSTSEDKTVILWNTKQVQEIDPFVFGCNWVRDYLKTNPTVSEGNRHLCNFTVSRSMTS
jgi:WD40 repeat protein